MIKRICKRSLSIFLCLVLIATTFFIFDPSVLKLDADAYVNVESNNTGASMGSQEMHAPECIYLRPGSNQFREFLDFNSASGGVTETANSGTVSFSNPTATEVQIAVNKVYYKNGSTDTNVATGSLKLNDTTINAYAGCSASSTGYATSPTVVASGSTSASISITSGSLSGYTAGRQYYIQWVVRYKIENTYHFAFMYTGIYAPDIRQAGASIANDDDQGNGDSGDEKNHAYTFITGAQNYYGGNRSSGFTGTGTGVRTAPLISFVGQHGDNTSGAVTIPGNSSQWNNTDNFPVAANGGVYVPTTGPNDRKVGRQVNYFSYYTSVGTVTNPTAAANKVRIEGTKNKYDDNGTSIGMSYIMVDTSRFPNYNQIPNLSIGWAQFYHQKDGNGNRLEYITEGTIASENAAGANVSGGITASVNKGNQEGGENDSFIRGLYKLNGTVTSGLKYIRVHYMNGWKAALGMGSESSYIHVFLGLNVQTSDKGPLRSVYAKALRSNIDFAYANTASAIENINYTDYYNRLKTAGENLANQLGAAPMDSTLDGYVDRYQGIIKQAVDSSVYFYVPEVIYINPNNRNMQYFVDRGNSDNSGLSVDPVKGAGNVYFHCSNATTVNITYSVAGTINLNQASAQNGTISTTFTGSLNSYSNTWVTWTARYTDKTSGKQLTATAYSYCFAGTKIGNSSVVSSSANAGDEDHTNHYIGVTSWITGCYTVDCRGYTPTSASGGTSNTGSLGDASGSYKSNWIQGTGVPTVGGKSISVYDSGQGGSGYWSSDSDIYWTQGGKGTFIVDSSRYTNMGQIPYFDIGIDCNCSECKYGITTFMELGYDWVTSASNPLTHKEHYKTEGYGNDLRGQRRNYKAEYATFAQYQTETKTLGVTAHGQADRSGGKGDAYATCYAVISFRNKANLRTAYETMIKNYTALQEEFFVSGKWTTFTSARNLVRDYLLNPASGATQSQMDTAANNLINAVKAMVACVKADAGTTTAQYKNTSNSTVTVNRADYLKSGTAKVYHRVINGDTVSSATSPLNVALGANSTTNVETKTYFYGETVKTGYNETPGYSYVGYNRQYADVQWTSTANGALTGNSSGTNMYGSSGHTEDIVITQPYVNVTYVYHRDVKTLYKNYGDDNIESTSVLPNFEAVPNLVNLSTATFNTTWQVWGNRNAATNINSALTTTTGFTFTISACGHHSSNPSLYYNDIFITNATTANLVAGQKYTLSFASNLGADAIRYYINGNNFETDFEYEPGMIECYVGTSNGTSFDGTQYLDKIDLEFTQGGAIGSFTASANTKAAILFRVITDGTNRFSGTVSNVRMAKGDFVETGLYDSTINIKTQNPVSGALLDAPTRIGYEFLNWDTGAPFTGELSGTNNATYKFGLEGGEIVANWLIKKYDIAFDNEYDFDNWANSVTKKSYETRDLNANEVTLDGTQTTERPITNYGNSVGLIVGHTYRVVADCYVTNEACLPKIHIKHGSGNNYLSAGVVQPGNMGRIEGTFAATDTTATLAYYVSNQNGTETTHNGVTTFGNLYIQDVTTPTGVIDGNGSDFAGGGIKNGPKDSVYTNAYSYTTTNRETGALLGENVCEWDVANYNAGNHCTITKDTTYQTFTMTSTGTDAYTSPYSGATAAKFPVVAGHVYRFSYMYENTSSIDAELLPYTFAFADGATSYGSNLTNFRAVAYGNTKGVHTFEWTIPAGCTSVSTRFGINNSGPTVKFSNLNIIDITAATTAPKSDSVKYHDNVYMGELLTKAQPILTRPGFVFDGWCVSQDATGNGTGAMANINNVMEDTNKHLYAKWSCNVVYDENGGKYKDSTQSARNRTGIAPGTSIAVSNRVEQGGTNWNHGSRSVSYVPYKVGYNFAGWKAYYEDGTSSSTNYWPSDAITVNQNVRFVAQWTAATTISLDTQYTAGASAHGVANSRHYAGQIWFYKFRPSTNMQVTAYTYNNGSNARDPFMYFVPATATTVTTNTNGKDFNNDYGSVSSKWGLDTSTYLASGGYNSLTNNNLNANTDYYYGFTLNGVGYNADSYNFKISENKVIYTLDSNGGNAMSPNTYTGHYNTALSVPAATRTGYTFAGWKANSAPTSTYIGTNATSNASIPAADNTTRINAVTNTLNVPCTLVAQWNINSYDLRVKAYYNSATAPTTASTTYNNGNTGGTVSITANGNVVSIVSDSTDSVAHAKVQYQAQANMVATPKTGYYFRGFYTAPTLNTSNQITAWGTAATNVNVAENNYTEAKTGTSVAMGTSGLTYYARFDIRQFSLRVRAFYNTAANVNSWAYGATGGTVGVINTNPTTHDEIKNIYYQQRPTITAKAATGYEFKGWYVGDDSTTAKTSWGAVASSSASYQVPAKAAVTERYWARFDIKSFTLYAYAYNNTAAAQTSWTNGVTGGTVAISAAQNGGSGLGTASQGVNRLYYWNSTVSLKATPATGYNFVSWYSTTTAPNTATPITNWNTLTYYNADASTTKAMPANNIYYIARFDIQKHNVNVYVQGNAASSGIASTTTWNRGVGGTVKVGSNAYNATSSTLAICYGTTTTIYAKPNTGYYFKGLYTGVTLSGTTVTAWNTAFGTTGDFTTEQSRTTASMGTSDLNYYARFDIKPINLKVYAYYRGATSDIALQANWANATTGGTVKINNGTAGKDATLGVFYNQTATITASPATGYTFNGWYSSVTGGNGSAVTAWGTQFKDGTTANTAVTTENINQERVYYAKFDIKSNTVTLKAYSNTAAADTTFANNATGGTVGFSSTPADATATRNVYYNQNTTIYAKPATGYEFAGWYTNTTFTGTASIAASACTNSSGVYSKQITNVTAAATYNAKFVIVGYDLRAYAKYNTAAATNTYNQGEVGGTVAITANGNIVKVQSDSTNTVAHAKVYYGQTAAMVATAKTGYNFDGWYSDPALTSQHSSNASAASSAMTTAGLNYYAKFSVKSYNAIAYAYSNTADGTYTNSNVGGTVVAQGTTPSTTAGAQAASSTTSQYFGGIYTVRAYPATGYTFEGWFADSVLNVPADGTCTTLTMSEAGGFYNNSYYYRRFTKRAEEEKVYAKFSISKPQLIVYAYANTGANLNTYINGTTGGTVKISTGTYTTGINPTTGSAATATANVYYNKTASITATPVTGYSFSGWYTSVTGGNGSAITAWGTRASTSATMTTANMPVGGQKYYARFDVDSFTIVLNPNGGASGSTSRVTAYYNTACSISQSSVPTRTGYDFLGWAETSTSTVATWTYSNSACTFSTTNVNNWHSEVGKNGEKTLYAVWKAWTYHLTISSAYDTPTAPNSFTVGTTGGTAELDTSTLNTGDIIWNHIIVNPATGYEYNSWRFGSNATAVSNGAAISTTWGDYQGTNLLQMPAYTDGANIRIVVYFSVAKFKANAYAMSNNATATGSYTNNAAGGTVKYTSTGAPGATAEASVLWHTTATFYAAPSTGYRFDGWFTDPALTLSAGSNDNITVTVQDTRVSGQADVNKRYAKFSILTYTAYGRAKYFTDGIDAATGSGINGIDGGTVKVASTTNTAGVTTTNADAVSIQALYTEEVTYTATPNSGYMFVGWYLCDNTDTLDEFGTEIETDISDGVKEFSFTMPEENVRVHARFVPHNLFVVLDPNGGVSGAVYQVTLTFNKAQEIGSDSLPTWTGHSFSGWAPSSSATTPTWTYTDNVCTFTQADINSWYASVGKNGIKTIFAVWNVASFEVLLNHMGGVGGQASVTVTVGQDMPTFTDLPTYSGYKLSGYYSEYDSVTGEYNEADKYYNITNDGRAVSNQVWTTTDDGVLYAKWTCPILNDATYTETPGGGSGTWTYTYEQEGGGTTSVTKDSPITDADDVTESAPEQAKEITSIATPVNNYIETKIEQTTDINLNHYNQAALSSLLDSVNNTNTSSKLALLSQPEINAYIAKISKDKELSFAGNRKMDENIIPKIKVYETASKLTDIKSETITRSADSANGSIYTYPQTTEAANYAFAGKGCNRIGGAPVNYYLYTNSRTPVIAVEIDDGSVGTTVANNTASYPTKATIADNYDASLVTTTAASDNKTYTESAVKATDDITRAWFYPYIEAGIGTRYDYNAKKVIYLTPTFTSTNVESKDSEIVYTITPTDDAYVLSGNNVVGNVGVNNNGLELAGTTDSLKNKFSSYNSENTGAQYGENQSITICINYHNAMNGISEEGGVPGDPYLQLYPDQVDKDTWLNQMHLFRTAGGASNWELPQVTESNYPVNDKTFADTGYVLGSFAYIFDSTNEPVATSYASAGDYEAAKNAIINSIKMSPSEIQNAIPNSSNALHYKRDGLGFFNLGGWSTNFYPKRGSYVYAHLVDRWGNVFNKVWKCFNVDSYASTITGSTNGFLVFEDGGSNISSFSLANVSNLSFVTDSNSSFEDGVFTTTGKSFSVSTGVPNKTYSFTVMDKASNKKTANVKSDAQGNITFNVDDACGNFNSGAYTFMFNGVEVNLCAGEPALIQSATVTPVSIVGDEAIATVVTSANATKIQLVENGNTRTYAKDNSNVTVTENEDGTLVWTIKFIERAIGEHNFLVKGKDAQGWQDTEFVLNTTIIETPAPAQEALKGVADASVNVGEKANVKVKVAQGTQTIRFIFADGTTTTLDRKESYVVAEVDGIETWAVPVKAFGAAGEQKIDVIAKYNNKWEKENVRTFTLTVNAKTVESPTIYSVKAQKDKVSSGEFIDVVVITNTVTTKLQFVLENGSTITYSASNAVVSDNGDGTLIWTVSRKFTTLGENALTLKARSAKGWGEAESFGSVTVE